MVIPSDNKHNFILNNSSIIYYNKYKYSYILSKKPAFIGIGSFDL